MSSLHRKSFNSSLKIFYVIVVNLTKTTQILLVDRNFFEKLVLIKVVHHVDLFVVIRRQDAVEHSVHHRFLSLGRVIGDAFRVDDGQIVAGSLDV